MDSAEQIVAHLAVRQSVYRVLESGPGARNVGTVVAWVLTGLIVVTLGSHNHRVGAATGGRLWSAPD